MRLPLVLLILSSAVANGAQAQLVTLHEAMLVATDTATDNTFAWSVSLSADGTRALVGVLRDDTAGGVDAGSARVFVRAGTTWAEEASLVAPDGAAGDLFGFSVALSADGSRAIVGARADDIGSRTDAGSARVFLRTDTSWAEEAVLIAPDGAAGDYFGQSVAFSSDGGRAVVGAPSDDAGSARVFLRTGTSWVQETALVGTGGLANDFFGASVALASDGSRALIGATTGGSDRGSARVFLRAGTRWSEEATLLMPAGWSDLFGHAVALSSDGSRALVGAPFYDTATGVGAGSAWAFLRSGTTWALEAILEAPDGAMADNLGYSVALSADGTRALVGAYQDDAGAGTARVFVRSSTGWSQEATLRAPDAEANDTFGRSVALSSDGGRALVAAPADDVAGVNAAGSAHVFTIALAPTGATCGGGAACTSGFCTDGLCCSTACGGGATDDCVGCSAALTGAANGTCSSLSAAAAPMVTCRASIDPICDPAETCDGVTTTCPLDVISCGTVDAGPLDAGGGGDADPGGDGGPRSDAGGRIDASPGSDAGRTADAGGAAPAVAGCQCHLAPSPARRPILAAAVVAFGVLGLRRWVLIRVRSRRRNNASAGKDRSRRTRRAP